MGPEVCVIVPTYGHFDYARRAVESLRDCRGAVTAACVLVDDASPEWPAIDWSAWPARCRRIRYRTHGGLSRSWNAGLRLARVLRARYAVCTNSDVLFSNDWFAPLAAALEDGFALVGPVTNAPGDAPAQNARRFLPPGARLTDAAENREAVARRLRRRAPFGTALNGFFLMARTSQWWRGAYSERDVFLPGIPLEGNEDELQERWFRAGYAAACAPASYIFHYRSISRPRGLLGRSADGAYRPGGRG